MGNLRCSKANPDSLNEIINLLKESNLPFSNINDKMINFFWIAEDGKKLIGCAGIEIFNEDGLLRSFAAKENFRGKGIGENLYKKIKIFTEQKELKKLHLLTNTAESFFPKKDL